MAEQGNDDNVSFPSAALGSSSGTSNADGLVPAKFWASAGQMPQMAEGVSKEAEGVGHSLRRESSHEGADRQSPEIV